tara:strand:- start:18 stop:467 length:450 start_codon:yes stop_codon:yes gene_type:complete
MFDIRYLNLVNQFITQMTNKSKKILSEISAGELLDKISILEIKLDKIKNKNSQEEINKEYKLLKEAQNSKIEMNEKTQKLFKEIKEVNLKLWNIEDKIRICEKNKDFGKDFIELARAVYLTNDARAKIKSQINELLGSNIKEVKQYVDY